MPRRLLLATSHAFWRNTHGADARIGGMLDFLAGEGWNISIFFLGCISLTDHEHLKRRAFRFSINSFPFDNGLFSAMPPNSYRSFVTPAAEKEFLDMARRFAPEIIIIEQVYLGALIQGYSGPAKLLIDTLDVMHERFERMSRAGVPLDYLINRDQEIAVLRKFDTIIAINDRDRETFISLVPEVNVIVAGHSLKSRAINRVVPDNTINLLYVLGQNPPNAHSMNLFMQGVWPQLVRRFGAAVTLHIAGYGSTSLKWPAWQGESVRLYGHVESLEPLYRMAHIVLNPVITGSGLKIKNVEALAYGKALVTTPIGAEGLEGGAHTAFLVGGSEEELLSMISSLVTSASTRRKLEIQARKYFIQHLECNTVYRELLCALGDVDYQMSA